MKNITILAITFCILLVTGCTTTPATTNSPGSVSTIPLPDGKTSLSSYESSDLWEYFPMDTGAEWTYNIKIDDVKPARAEEIWITGKEEYYHFSDRVFFNPISGVKNYHLRIKVKGPEQETQRPGTIELEILRDDLGLFRHANQIFWGKQLNPSGWGGNNIMEMGIEYSADSLMKFYPEYSQQLKDASSVHSSRVIFFGGRNMAKMDKSIGESKIETISCLGLDSNVPGYKGIPCLHFFREVYPPVDSPEIKTITEDSWFAKGKGLIRFEQKVGGKPSMTWTIE